MIAVEKRDGSSNSYIFGQAGSNGGNQNLHSGWSSGTRLKMDHYANHIFSTGVI